MTIDEAIKHCEEVAEVNENIADNCDMDNWMNKAGCEERASDYRQIADWLRELQELREKHWDECRQIAHYDNDLKEVIKLTGTTIETALENLDAKDMIRVLATYLYDAIDGFRALGKYLDDHCKIDLDCDKCPLQNGGNCRSWKHTKAVLKLIGGI
ncbi:MAG: hypothetical protein J6Y64_06265 [Ruminococcus sp.]|nr:hypothetical protein [Ruminococcus sp.]